MRALLALAQGEAPPLGFDLGHNQLAGALRGPDHCLEAVRHRRLLRDLRRTGGPLEPQLRLGLACGLRGVLKEGATDPVKGIRRGQRALQARPEHGGLLLKEPGADPVRGV